MTFKGSIVIKKKDILGKISDLKLMFRTNIRKESKHFLWGQREIYETILEEDYSPSIDWNEFMQRAWGFKYNMKIGIDFILGEKAN